MQATALRKQLKGAITLTEETTTTTFMKQQCHKKGKEKETAGLNYEKWAIFTNSICIYYGRT